MKRLALIWFAWCLLAGLAAAADRKKDKAPAMTHPDASKWEDLFTADLSNAIRPRGVWTVSEGVLAAAKDEAIWTGKDYDNFVLDLEFKNAPGTNSGVFV